MSSREYQLLEEQLRSVRSKHIHLEQERLASLTIVEGKYRRLKQRCVEKEMRIIAKMNAIEMQGLVSFKNRFREAFK